MIINIVGRSTTTHRIYRVSIDSLVTFQWLFIYGNIYFYMEIIYIEKKKTFDRHFISLDISSNQHYLYIYTY